MENPDDPNESPGNQSKGELETTENGGKDQLLFSPRFRSVAAMAGWDEEALLVASLIVEDTPDRQIKNKKRSDIQIIKSPQTNSRRKRKAQAKSHAAIQISILKLDEDKSDLNQDIEVKKKEEKSGGELEKPKKNEGDDEVNTNKSSDIPSSSHVVSCIDRLREELSCAICLEICYEPSTTPCGHSFCRKCLRSAADNCGKKCPKCRQLISNGRYCTVNTVLWNTIQLLFPQDVETRKGSIGFASDAAQLPKVVVSPPSRTRVHNTRNRVIQALNSPESETESSSVPERRNHHRRIRSRSSRTERELPSQDEDAALALRLQREEFMEVFRGTRHDRSSVDVARANLRAMASRAISIRVRSRRN